MVNPRVQDNCSYCRRAAVPMSLRLFNTIFLIRISGASPLPAFYVMAPLHLSYMYFLLVKAPFPWTKSCYCPQPTHLYRHSRFWLTFLHNLPQTSNSISSNTILASPQHFSSDFSLGKVHPNLFWSHCRTECSRPREGQISAQRSGTLRRRSSTCYQQSHSAACL